MAEGIFSPDILAQPVPPPAEDVKIPADPLAQSARWKEIQVLAMERPLSSREVQEMVQLTRALRRTNTGPAKAKTSKAKAPKKAASLDDILGD
jgi:hypothetical protein